MYFDGKNVYYYLVDNSNNSNSINSNNSNNGVNRQFDVSSSSHFPDNSNNANTSFISQTLPAVSSMHSISSTVEGRVVDGQPLCTYMHNRTDSFQSPTQTANDMSGHEVRVATTTTTTTASQEFDVSNNSTDKESNNSVKTITVAHVFRSGGNSTSEPSHNNPLLQTSTNATSAPQ